MHSEIVQDGINALGLGRDLALDPIEEVDPVGSGATIIGMSQSRAIGRLEGAKVVAPARASIVDLLPGPLGWLCLAAEEPLPREGLGSFGSHLV